MTLKELETFIRYFRALFDAPYEEYFSYVENLTKWIEELDLQLIQKNGFIPKKPICDRIKNKNKDESLIQCVKVPREVQRFVDEGKENIPTRRVTRQMRAQMSVIIERQSIEMQTSSNNAKRTLSIITNINTAEEETFIVPEQRGRGRKKKEPVSLITASNDDTILVDSRLGAAVCHSSLKASASTSEKTYVIPKMTLTAVKEAPEPKSGLIDVEQKKDSLSSSPRSLVKSVCVSSPAPHIEKISRTGVQSSLIGDCRTRQTSPKSPGDFITSTDDDNYTSAPGEPILESAKENVMELRVTRSKLRDKNSRLIENEPPVTVGSKSSRQVDTSLIKQERLTMDVEVTSPAVNGGETFMINKLSEAMEVEQFARKSRKSAFSMLARKSLNKAKRILNEREQLQAKLHSPVPRKECEHLLPASPSLNVASSNAKTKVPLSKNEAQLTLTGKGKFQNLNDEVEKNCKVTPAKTSQEIAKVTLKSSAKRAKDLMEKELKLKALREKEEEATKKKLEVIRSRQAKLKLKNEIKLRSASKQRQKLEMEKQNNMIRAEKEKEDKHKQLLEERRLRQKEKAMEKKRIMEQKMAEAEERRRLEEGMRIAKLKEQEAEQERLMLEKQKEFERHERHMQELLAEQKAREKYEMQLKNKKELAAVTGTATKGCLQQVHSSKKPPRPIETKAWNYKPRNKNDLGLEHENSDIESDEEEYRRKRSYPLWVKRFNKERHIFSSNIPSSSMTAFMACERTTPDIDRMFNITPRKRIKRTSSAIWNTPSS